MKACAARRANARHHANFPQNQSNHSRDIAIYQLFKYGMVAARHHITVSVVKNASVHDEM